jgi:hypothetical protein
VGTKTINGKKFTVDKRTVNLGIGGVLNLSDIMDRSAIGEEPNPTDVVVIRLEARYDNLKNHFHRPKKGKKTEFVDEQVILTVDAKTVEILEVHEAPPEPEQMEIGENGLAPDEPDGGDE